MTKTKSRKFGPAVPENQADYLKRKLAGEHSFRAKRITGLLSNFPNSDIDHIISRLEELSDHATGWLRFARAIKRLAEPAKPAELVEPFEEEDPRMHGMEGL